MRDSCGLSSWSLHIRGSHEGATVSKTLSTIDGTTTRQLHTPRLGTGPKQRSLAGLRQTDHDGIQSRLVIRDNLLRTSTYLFCRLPRPSLHRRLPFKKDPGTSPSRCRSAYRELFNRASSISGLFNVAPSKPMTRFEFDVPFGTCYAGGLTGTLIRGSSG